MTLGHQEGLTEMLEWMKMSDHILAAGMQDGSFIVSECYNIWRKIFLLGYQGLNLGNKDAKNHERG